MITAPLPAVSMAAPKGSGLAVPSLPAATTMNTPAAAACATALVTADDGGSPPSDRLITFAPCAVAYVIAAAIVLPANEQPPVFESLDPPSSTHVPGVSERSAISVAPQAIPRMPVSSRAAAATIATLVP